jgi:ADP-heptose:LPS heptosyltransferase
VVDLVGVTSVGGLMAAVERAAIVVANDSAALHMAVGFDRPLVALFGPTRIDRVGPYGRAGDVIQKLQPGERLDHKDDRLGRGLMERITLEEVLDAAASRVGKADTITRC